MAWRRPWGSDPPEVIGLREFLTLLPDVGKRSLEYAAGVVGYPFVRQHRRTGRQISPPTRPTTEWADVVNALVHDTLPTEWRRHSERTWQFATALAEADQDGKDFELDLGPEFQELIYVAAMLHDSALVAKSRTRCFAVAGAENAWSTAADLSVPDRKIVLVAEAISSHISVDPGNALGKYIQLGSLLDITGYGVWRLDPAFVSSVCENSPREGFPEECRKQWAQECEAFPNGRAAYARIPGLLVAASYMPLLPR